jgi:hypothetical protein
LSNAHEAANVADMTHERRAEAEIYRLRGTLYASINEQTTAQNAYGCAITVARTQERQILGTSCSPRCRTTLAGAGYVRSSSRAVVTDLQLVH